MNPPQQPAGKSSNLDGMLQWESPNTSVAFHSLIVHLIDPLSIWILSIWIINIVYTSLPPEKFSAFTFPLPYRTNMDSEAESSLLAPLTTVDLALTCLTRTRIAVVI